MGYSRKLTTEQQINDQKLLFAKELRRRMTKAERYFWHVVRRRKYAGYRFRRQQIIDGFIVDFYCSKLHMVIEIDGAAHAFQKEYDAYRTWIVSRNHGLRVLRFSNDEVLGNIEGVMEKIFVV